MSIDTTGPGTCRRPDAELALIVLAPAIGRPRARQPAGVIARGESAEAQAPGDGDRRGAAGIAAARIRSGIGPVPELAVVVEAPAVGRSGAGEAAGVRATRGEDHREEWVTRHVAEAGAASGTAVAARGHNHVPGPGAGRGRRGPRDLGRTYHGAAAELAAADGHAGHVDEIGAGDGHAGSAGQRAIGGTHGRDRC